MNSQSNTITTPFSFSFSFPSAFSTISPHPLFNFTMSTTVEKMDYMIIEDTPEPVPMELTSESVPMEWTPVPVPECTPEPVPMDWEHEHFQIEFDENGFDPDL